MKKVLIILASLVSIGLSAQSSLRITDMSTSLTVNANDTLYLTTEVEDVTTVVFDLKNIGSTTKTYKVTRTDILLNTGASAYYCFAGYCYPSGTTTSPDADTLNAGQSASGLSGDYKMLTTDLLEGTSIGKSIVDYSIFNVDNATDVFKFTIKYNYSKPVGIKESAKLLSSFEIFPNPAKDVTSILINSPKALEASLLIINSLGQTVHQEVINVTEGKNKVDMNLHNLQSGVYFASIKTGNSTISKKLIIE